MKAKNKEIVQGYLFMVPIAVLLLSLSLYPMIRTVFLSFQNVRLATMTKMSFAGLRNYLAIFNREAPNFWRTLIPNTLMYVFGSVIGQIGFGFLLAILINSKGIKGKSVFRAITILPWVVSGIIISISWRFMYEPRLGIINYLLSLLGVKNTPTWLNDPNLVMASLIIANIWHGVPFCFIIQTSGLQSISEDIYEASVIDGASSIQRLRFITIPMMKQFLIMNLIMTTMNTINSFDLIYATTKGGPLYRSEVLAVHMYRRAFDFGRLGEGSAVAVIILLMNLIFTVFYLKRNKDRFES